MTTVDNSGVYVYYLKGIVSVCFTCPARTVGFSWNTPVLVHLPTKLSDAPALPTPWLGRSTRGLQPGGDVHKEAVHLLSLQPASITSSGTFKPECNGDEVKNEEVTELRELMFYMFELSFTSCVPVFVVQILSGYLKFMTDICMLLGGDSSNRSAIVEHMQEVIEFEQAISEVVSVLYQLPAGFVPCNCM